MANITDYLEAEIIDYFLRNDANTFSPIAQLYLGIFQGTAPSDAVSGTEVAGGSYARQAITFTDASTGHTENTATLTFACSGTAWATIEWAAVFDALASGTGNMYLFGTLGTARNIGDGESLTIASADFDFDLD